MIKRIQIKDHPCFQDVDINLNRFNVFVGPNGSGKTSFYNILLDISALMRQEKCRLYEYIKGGCSATLQFGIPKKLCRGNYDIAEYKITIENWPNINESLTLLSMQSNGNKPIITANEIYSETHNLKWLNESRLMPKLYDLDHFPITTWCRQVIQNMIKVDCCAITFCFYELLKNNIFNMGKDGYNNWMQHIQCCFPEIKDIYIKPTIDKWSGNVIKKIIVSLKNGITFNSNQLSTGMRFFIYLTSIAYVNSGKSNRIFLIEHPENNIDPYNMESLYQSLSSVYDGQVFVTSHSVSFLNCVKKKNIFCFQKNNGRIKIEKASSISDCISDSIPMGQLFASGFLHGEYHDI